MDQATEKRFEEVFIYLGLKLPMPEPYVKYADSHSDINAVEHFIRMGGKQAKEYKSFLLSFGAKEETEDMENDKLIYGVVKLSSLVVDSDSEYYKGLFDSEYLRPCINCKEEMGSNYIVPLCVECKSADTELKQLGSIDVSTYAYMISSEYPRMNTHQVWYEIRKAFYVYWNKKGSKKEQKKEMDKIEMEKTANFLLGKFQVGDKVKVLDCAEGSHGAIGKIGIIVSKDTYASNGCGAKNGIKIKLINSGNYGKGVWNIGPNPVLELVKAAGRDNNNQVWVCSEDGYVTVCVYCEKNQVKSSKILSICEICRPDHSEEFSKAATAIINRGSNEDLWSASTRIKTAHALKVIESKKSELQKTVEMLEEYSKKVASKKKVTAYNPKNNNKPKGKVLEVITVGYVLPCFSRMFAESYRPS